MTSRWWHFGIFNPYGSFNVKRQGKIDGKLSLPPWNSAQQPDFLRELYHLTQTTLDALAQAWHILDRQLKGLWMDATLNQKQAAKELVQAAEREEKAQSRYEDVHGRRLTLDGSAWRFFLYWLVVALVFVGEFPLNGIAFEQFGESAYKTWLMTGIVATAMVVCAHSLGKQLHEEASGRPLAIVWRVLLVAVPLGAIVCVALLRSDYVQQQALSGSSPAQLLAINVTISVLVFFCLAFYSFNVHDPVVQAVLNAWKERRTKERLLHLAEKATASARIDREQKHRKMLRDASGWLSEVRRRAAAYRRVHIRVRPDRDQTTPVPAWFNLEPEIQVPADLTTLDWNMHQASNPGEKPELSLTAVSV